VNIPLLKKTIAGVVGLFLVSAFLYVGITRWKIASDLTANLPVFSSKVFCEFASGKKCGYVECNYTGPLPHDEVCGRNFSPGWVPLR